MALGKRIELLETKRGLAGGTGNKPSMIFLCDETGEPGAAIIVGGDTILREPDETREAFEARASAGAPAAIFLPDNGRDALANGETPQWAQGALAMRALRQKHADPN